MKYFTGWLAGPYSLYMQNFLTSSDHGGAKCKCEKRKKIKEKKRWQGISVTAKVPSHLTT
jgi:hypothetical protein